MSGGKKRGKIGRRLPGMILSAASLAVLVYIAITLISGRELGTAWLKGLFRPKAPVARAYEPEFDVGGSRVFADLGGYIAAAGTFGTQVLGADGDEAYRETYRMASPAISPGEGYAIAFDIGGNSVRVLGKTRMAASIESPGAVISASVNRNGWFCVCSQDAGAYASIVTAYDNKGREVYKVSLARGYATAAALTRDNKRMAVLVLADEGSRITLYDLASDAPAGEYDAPGTLILGIARLDSGDTLAITQESLLIVDGGGQGKGLYSYLGRRLRGYALHGNRVALYLLDYGVGYSGSIVMLTMDGEILGERATDREIISMSCGDGFLAVLKNDGATIYDDVLEIIPLSEDELARASEAAASGASRAYALEGSAVLVAGDNTAMIIAFERNAGQ